MIRKTYGEVKQSKPAEVHNEPVETLEEIGLDASAVETAVAALSGILGLPAVAFLSQKAQDKLKAVKSKVSLAETGETLEEVGLDASAVETAVAALSGILGLPAVAFLSQKAQDKLKAVKSKVSLEEEYEATDHDIQIGPAMAGMVNIRKYLERSAPEYLDDLKAIDSVLTTYDTKMAYGDGDDLGVPGDNALGLEETIKRADAIIAEATRVGANEGLLKEALNKPLNKFGQDLEKRLNALGFETKIFPGKSGVPQEASDEIIVKGSKKAGISYIKTSAGHEHIQVMVNADEINKLKKVKSYFKTADGQYSPDKEIGWVIKNVKLTNPGDIMASDVQRYGKRAILEYYTSQEGGEKVKTRDVEF